MTLEIANHIDILVEREEGEVPLYGLDVTEAAYFFNHLFDGFIETTLDFIARMGIARHIQMLFFQVITF